MSTPSSQRKITAPPLPFAMVSRPALIERLNEAIIGNISDPGASTSPYKLILLEAPAGYGKTTLLAEFGRQSPIPCCWYLFDHNDSKPLTFLRTLLESLRQRFPTFGEPLVPLLYGATAGSAESEYLQKILEALVESLTREIPERFALLLCQYHEVSEYSTITSMVEYLIHHMPEQGVLVLESREVPELDFASLLARHAMLGIGRYYLRFSAQEIRELARVQGSRVLSEREAEQLAAAFDGWIAGILIGTRLGGMQFLERNGGTAQPRQSQDVLIHAQTLFTYVVNEIFKRHQDAYNFLREAVILQEMRPAVCAELLGLTVDDASQYLHVLEQHGLFVTHSGEWTELVYTCHRVLRDLLYEELRQQAPERFVQLHRRAAEILSAQHRYEQAIFHAMEARVDEIAARLIIASAEQMIEQGHLETLQQWIEAFPETTRTAYPKLLLILTDIYVRKSELNKALPLLERISTLLSGSWHQLANPEEVPLLQAELTITRAHTMIQRGRYQQAQHLCQQVLEHLPADEVKMRAWAHTYFGSCAEYLGDPATKIAHYQKALQLWGRHTISSTTASEHDLLADTYRRLGNLALAEHHSTRATACWEQLQDIRGTINNLIVRAYLVWDQRRLDEAERLLQQALELSIHPLHLQRLQGYALVSLGEFYQSQGLYDRSLTSAEEGLALARQLGDTNLLNDALLTLALTYLYMGDAATADLLISEILVEVDTSTDVLPLRHVMRDLAMGTVLLHQYRYAEAQAILEPTEAALRAVGFKREQIKAQLRLAACYLGQKKLPNAFQELASIEKILTTFDGGYELLVHAELRVQPLLLQAIERRPETASLRSLLHLPPAKQVKEGSILQETEGKAAPPAPSIRIPKPTNAPRLKIVAMGEPVVLLDEQPITRWRMARAMELFFYLLDNSRPMRKEQILTALWEEVDEQTMQTFYSTIHYLRKALGGEAAITSRAGVYKLDLASVYGKDGAWYDVAIFEEQYELGRQALDEEKDEKAIASFETMVELYQGDYVQPFYSDWCSLRRDELRSAYVDAHRQLAQIAWRTENIEESAAHWQQMLAVDSYLEQAHCGLMRCYIRQGKRGLALRQYQRCKEALEQELGAAPGITIQNLYRRLMGLPQSDQAPQ